MFQNPQTLLPIIFFGIVLLILILISVTTYNALIRLRQEVDRAWANIDVILKQRFDEIPSLVQVIEQYAQYEKGIINQLAEARTRYLGARSANEKIQVSADLNQAFGGFLALGENYPELKANASFVQLQTRVSSLEESLADRREVYNEIVSIFNARILQIPHVIFARLLGYQAFDSFQVSAKEREKPSLKMNL